MGKHLCTETDCPYQGQPSPRICSCHQTDEQVLEAVNADLLAALQLLVQRCGQLSEDGKVARAAISKALGQEAGKS